MGHRSALPSRAPDRLEVASSAHPKYATNLGTGGDETTATEGVVATNVIHHDLACPSRLLLTVAGPSRRMTSARPGEPAAHGA